jgi:hypothetical protein
VGCSTHLNLIRLYGVLAVELEELGENRGDTAPGRRVHQRPHDLLGSCSVGAVLIGGVGDDGHSQGLHAPVGSDDDFRDRRHAHRVHPDLAEEQHFGRRLVGPSGLRGQDASADMHRLAGQARSLIKQAAQARIILPDVFVLGLEVPISSEVEMRPEERIGYEQANVALDDHEVARPVRRIRRPNRAGRKIDLDAKRRHDLNGEGNVPHGLWVVRQLVVVGPTGEPDDRYAGNLADDQLASVSRSRGHEEMRNLIVADNRPPALDLSC